MSIRLLDGISSQLFTQDMLFDHILQKCEGIDMQTLNLQKVAQNVYPKLLSDNTVEDVDDLIVSVTTSMMIDHPDYQKIAVRILIDRLHSQTHENYEYVLNQLLENKYGDKPSPIVSQEYADFVRKHLNTINEALDYTRDYDTTVFGFRTLEKAYLKRAASGAIIERPQHMWMRVAIGINYAYDDIDQAITTYHLTSQKMMIHATPTNYNSGTLRPQLSSCFLLGVDDSMDSITKSWRDSALISKNAGGLSVCLTSLRGDGSPIASTQGKSRGLQVAKVYNEIARYADQGGKRPGSIALYLEPWHKDIVYFLELRKNVGAETERARDIFTALMINDLFMHRVEQKAMWSLMCPDQCPNIVGKWGLEFEKAYIQYEKEGKYHKQVPAEDIYFKIMELMIESGTPYILFKDAINSKSNQINSGVINSSNLCAEIVQISTADEYAVCNLASICLPRFVRDGKFDYQTLYQVARVLARNLNRIIDINYYPVPETEKSNKKHRPMAIGVQGLADLFAIFRTPFDSPLARDLNKKIFETIYFGAMTESVLMAKESGPYETFYGSPLSEGKFQFDLWGIEASQLSGMWDWESLRIDVMQHGAANSLLTACMPTASTSQIMGNTEAIEPHSNLSIRSTSSGNYYVINRYLVEDLMRLGKWNSETIDMIKYYDGSIANIPGIPDNVKMIYRTVWEISQRAIIEMSADRAPFVDQTQSLNLFLEKPTYSVLNACIMKAWKLKLKTGSYYLRSRAPVSATKFGIGADIKKKIQEATESQVCRLMKDKNGGVCFSCS